MQWENYQVGTQHQRFCYSCWRISDVEKLEFGCPLQHSYQENSRDHQSETTFGTCKEQLHHGEFRLPIQNFLKIVLAKTRKNSIQILVLRIILLFSKVLFIFCWQLWERDMKSNCKIANDTNNREYSNDSDTHIYA